MKFLFNKTYKHDLQKIKLLQRMSQNNATGYKGGNIHSSGNVGTTRCFKDNSSQPITKNTSTFVQIHNICSFYGNIFFDVHRLFDEIEY